jgi:hypothetical protein
MGRFLRRTLDAQSADDGLDCQRDLGLLGVDSYLGP